MGVGGDLNQAGTCRQVITWSELVVAEYWSTYDQNQVMTIKRFANPSDSSWQYATEARVAGRERAT